MSGMSDYLEGKSVEHALGVTSWTMPTNTYVALFTSDPGDDASGNEVSGGAYARKLAAWNAQVAGACTNNGDIEFDVATASWGTITHFAIFDALISGNMLYHAALPTSETINIDNQFVILDTELTVSHQ